MPVDAEFARPDRDLIERARQSNILAIAQRYGARLKRAGSAELVGPCPVCGGHDRFSLNLKKQVWNCRGCDKGGDVIGLVRHLSGCGFKNAIEHLTGETSATFDPIRHAKVKAEDAEYQRRQHQKAAWFWSQRRPIGATIAETYLRKVRGITCPLPPTLAFLPPGKPEHHPAMIAAFGAPDELEPGVLAPPHNVEAVHFTLLKPDGGKAKPADKAKFMLGSPGAMPIVLAPANDLLALTITEGIEDCLTAHQVTGRGAWAAGAAGRMPALAQTLPEYIESVTICAHADKAGQDGALALADALDRRGVEVFVEGLP